MTYLIGAICDFKRGVYFVGEQLWGRAAGERSRLDESGALSLLATHTSTKPFGSALRHGVEIVKIRIAQGWNSKDDGVGGIGHDRIRALPDAELVVLRRTYGLISNTLPPCTF